MLAKMSPSSQRAWIEIGSRGPSLKEGGVALLAEGVDRNRHIQASGTLDVVALLAEGVDRNKAFMDKYNRENSRPPRRGRG